MAEKRVVQCELDFYVDLLKLLRPDERYMMEAPLGGQGIVLKTADDVILLFVHKKGKT